MGSDSIETFLLIRMRRKNDCDKWRDKSPITFTFKPLVFKENIMKFTTRIIFNAALLLIASLVIQNAASAQTSDRLQIPDGQTFLLSAEGVGYQIYTSEPKAGSTTEFEWKFKEPQAILHKNSDKKIGKHYAGPTWESKDGSKVAGKKINEVPAPKTHDIPWLLVEATSHEGEGLFSKVSYNLRVDTVGGIAPAHAPTGKGKETRVKYRATYLFLVPAVAK